MKSKKNYVDYDVGIKTFANKANLVFIILILIDLTVRQNLNFGSLIQPI